MSEQRRPPSETAAVDSDRHLVGRVRLGDKAAFEQLFERHYRPVQRVLCRMLGDPGLADDLARETFLALYTHPPQMQADDEGARAWLYRVALNRGYNALRAYLDGELPAADSAAVATHLTAFAACQAELDELAARREQVGRAVGGDIPSALSVEDAWARVQPQLNAARAGGAVPSRRPTLAIPPTRRRRYALLGGAAAVMLAALLLPSMRAFSRRDL